MVSVANIQLGAPVPPSGRRSGSACDGAPAPIPATTRRAVAASEGSPCRLPALATTSKAQP